MENGWNCAKNVVSPFYRRKDFNKTFDSLNLLYYPQITPENLNQKEVSVWYRISDQIGKMTKYGSKWTSLLTFPRKSRNRQNGWAFASLINAPLTKLPDA